MADATDTIACILSATTYYSVLGLAADEGIVTTAAVRRQYKTLAIRVHPDKNRADGAADAFKRLSEAYECLVDEHAQRAYLSTLTRSGTRRSPRPSRSRPPTAPYFSKKQWKKTRPSPPPPPPEPRQWRSPEDIWKAFQREEEEQAKREFHAKGFDRDYETPASKKRDPTRHDEGLMTEPPRNEEIHHAENIEIRAQSWMSWQQSRSSVSESSSPSIQATETVCCLLCRRKFRDASGLERHERLSTLHRENLARQAKGTEMT